MNEILDTVMRGPRQCPECGASNLRGQTYCHDCGARLRNRNPIVRLIVTTAAIGVIAAVVYFKLKR